MIVKTVPPASALAASVTITQAGRVRVPSRPKINAVLAAEVIAMKGAYCMVT